MSTRAMLRRWIGLHLPVFTILLGIAGLPASLAQEARIEFVSPRPLRTVLGETEIELRVQLPAGLRAERVVILADGTEVATLEGPPWKTMWDAGSSGKGHGLEAILHLSNGTRARAFIRTSRLRVTHFEEVSLVNLYAVVRNSSGSYVSDLLREDFRLTENGRAQTIDRFTAERKPLRVGIVLDTSLTMEGSKLEAARKAALGFLDVLETGDEGMVVAFSDDVHIFQELTADREALGGAVLRAEAGGGTALYDAIWRTSKELRQLEGRRVMVLLSDGRDEAASGLEPGSLHTLSEALDRALRDEVIIFAIGFGQLARQKDFYGRRTLKSILEELATATGGRALFPSRAGRLRKAFEDVASDLRHMYSLAYVSDNPAHDGSWRAIRLMTLRPGLTVYTRRGYYAPTEEGRGGQTGSY